MKIKTRNGYRFIKELGGAVRREQVSTTAQVLVDKKLVRGRVLDYGCGYGFDADHFGWDSYDPHYRQKILTGTYDTVICNHVANMLTRCSRQRLYEQLDNLLSADGVAYISVSRKIPTNGKAGLRKRIQNYVVLSLPSIYLDGNIEIYKLTKGQLFEDNTDEFEDR